MAEIEAAVVRRKLELYRDYLAKGVGGGMAVVYLVEISKLEALLNEIDDESVLRPGHRRTAILENPDEQPR